MAFSADDLRKLAHLSRLQLSDAEVEVLAPQLEQILGFVEKLAELNVDDVEPMTTAIDVRNRWEADQVESSLPREAALQNAPQADDECFLVPPVLPG